MKNVKRSTADEAMEQSKRTKLGDSLQDRIRALGPNYHFAMVFDIFSETMLFKGNEIGAPVIDRIVNETKKIDNIGAMAVDILVYHYNQPKVQKGWNGDDVTRSFERSLLKVTSGGENMFDLDNEYLQRVDVRNMVDSDKTDDQLEEEERQVKHDLPAFYDTIRIVDLKLLEAIKNLIEYWQLSTTMSTGKPYSKDINFDFETQLGTLFSKDRWEVDQFILDCESAAAAKRGLIIDDHVHPLNFGALMHVIYFSKEGKSLLVELLEKVDRSPSDSVVIERGLSLRSYLPMELLLYRNNVESLMLIFAWLEVRWDSLLGTALPDFYSSCRRLFYEIIRKGDEDLVQQVLQTNVLTGEIMSYLLDEENLPANQREEDQQAQAITPERKQDAYDKLWNSGIMFLHTPQFTEDDLYVVAFESTPAVWRMFLLDLRTNMRSIDIYLVATALVLAEKWEYIRELAQIENRLYTMKDASSPGEIDENALQAMVEKAMELLVPNSRRTRLGKWETRYLGLLQANKPVSKTLEDYKTYLVEKTSNIFIDEQFD